MSEPLPPKKARQGRRGLPVLIILGVALVLAAIAWWGAEIYGGAIAPDTSEQIGDPQDPSATAQPPATTPSPPTTAPAQQ